MDIFLSYSQLDKNWVNNLAQSLEQKGYTVWWDHDILAGDDFDEIIQSKLSIVRCVITIWSQNSIRSNWVRGESSIALERDVFIPISLHDVKPPVVFRSKHTLSLHGWDGDNSDPRFNKLLKSINKYCPDNSSIDYVLDDGSQTLKNGKKKKVTSATQRLTIGLTTLSLFGVGFYFEDIGTIFHSFKNKYINTEVSNKLAANDLAQSKDNSILVSKRFSSVSTEEELLKGINAYLNGKFSIALKLISPFIEEENGKAQFILARMYEKGHGVEKDIQKANDLYIKAFRWGENNPDNAAFILGYMYQFGNGVDQSISLSAKWYNKAAKQGQGELVLKDFLFQLTLKGKKGHITPSVSAADRHYIPNKPFSSLKGKLSWPVNGEIQNHYGSVRNSKQKWKGVIISAQAGTKVHAVARGKVEFSGRLNGYGYLIIIRHDKNYRSLYAYNRSVFKKEGQIVKAGEIIAAVGSSGGKTEPSLYFEIRKGTSHEDPAKWINKGN